LAYLENSSGATLSSAQSISSSSVASTNIFDVTGAGSGNLPVMIGAGGLNTAIGTDFGVGQSNAQPGVWFVVTTTGTGAGTISCSIEAAPDNGSGSPGSYTILSTSQAFVGTALVAGLNFWLPLPPVPSNYAGLPRFYEAYYTCASTVTASISAYFMMNPPDVKSVTSFGKNFSSAY
jgi:hypothetical protein